MINLLKSTIGRYYLFFFCFKVERIAVFGGRLKRSGIGLENNAIFSKYSSPDKSCQGQTYGRLLDRKHYLCIGVVCLESTLKGAKTAREQQ